MSVGGVEAQHLYRVSGNGLEKDSYLFGTHHVIPVSFLDSVPELFRAYNDCSTVIGEVMFNEEDVKKLMFEGYMDRTIDELLSEEERALVDSQLVARLGISLDVLPKMRPAMINQMYTLAMIEKVCPTMKDGVSMDMFFMKTAEELGMKVIGLETVEEQVKLLFHTQSLERQAELLVETMKNADGLLDDFRKLNEQYKKGDLEMIYEEFQKDTSGSAMTEGEKFLMLGNRNIKWVEVIDKAMRKDACFVAVGAMHLVGEDGLIELLRERGYRVKAY